MEYYQGSAAVHWREATPAAPSDVLQSCEEEVLGCLRIRATATVQDANR